MTGQQLRNSILQEAIQGRLVPNVLLSGEKTGAELLQDILAERQKKENEEKGKKAKRLSLSIIEDEPWELPDGWCWCSLEDFCTITAGQSPEGNDINEQEGIEFHQGKIYFGELYLKEANIYTKHITKIAHKDSVLLCMRAPVGIVNITPREICIGRGLSSIECYAPISSLFLCYWLRSYKDYFEDRATGSTFKAITGDIVKHTPIPLPPLSIQKAIVKKIEELFPLVDEYEKAAVELNALNEILPDKLRKSVLQEAIHGNLVSNDIPDGEATAPELLQQILKERQDRENKAKGKKAKTLSLSTIDEEPWDLPDGWCWCYLDEIVHSECSISYGIVQPGDNVPGGVPVVRPIDMTQPVITLNGLKRVSADISNSYKRTILRGGELLISVRGTIGVVSFASNELAGGNVTRGIVPLFFPDIIDKEYVRYALSAPMIQKIIAGMTRGAALRGINMEDLRKLPIPLPPLSLQHRIVEKIEEVFDAIDKL
ncbi:MAG: restriction endonuclease subunit S [Bacteroidales bacterium]|nr:restriction endonuclease subunit S [Bacteroidales bacterium]